MNVGSDLRRLGFVTGSSLAARLAILAMVAVAAARLSHSEFDRFVYLLAAASALQTLLDPGTGSWLVVRSAAAGVRGFLGEWMSGLVIQLFVGLAIVAGTIAVAAAAGGVGAIPVGIALGVLGATEGVIRYTRVVWQVRGQFHRYAAVDLAVGLGRLAVAAGCGLGGMRGVLLCALSVSLVLTLAAVVCTAHLWVHPTSIRSVARGTLPFGASTFFSGIYSQVPVVLVGLVGSVRTAVVYAIVARVTQPTELVPAAIASVFLPRLSSLRPQQRAVVFRRQLTIAVCAAVVIAASVVAVSPWLLPLLGLRYAEGATVVFILAGVLPLKFANYQLVARALADGRVVQRLIASALVAGVSVSGVVVIASQGATAVAGLALLCEALLCILLVRSFAATRLSPRPVT